MAKQTFTTGQVLTAAQMTSLQQTAMGGGSTTAKTTSYTLVAADAGTVVQMNSASATTITVNTALFAAGDTVQIQNIGAGVCTVTAGTATVSTAGSLALNQYEGGQLYFNTTSAAFFFDIVQSATSFNTNSNYVATSQSTTSTSYVGLTTAQAITVTTGTKALVSISASFENAAGVNVGARMSFAISGATTVAAADQFSTGIAFLAAGGGNYQVKNGATFVVTGLTAGSNVFTAQFKKGGGDTPGFAERTINVVDLGS